MGFPTSLFFVVVASLSFALGFAALASCCPRRCSLHWHCTASLDLVGGWAPDSSPVHGWDSRAQISEAHVQAGWSLLSAAPVAPYRRCRRQRSRAPPPPCSSSRCTPPPPPPPRVTLLLLTHSSSSSFCLHCTPPLLHSLFLLLLLAWHSSSSSSSSSSSIPPPPRSRSRQPLLLLDRHRRRRLLSSRCSPSSSWAGVVAVVVGKHERTCPHPSAEGRGTVGGRFIVGRGDGGGGGLFFEPTSLT